MSILFIVVTFTCILKFPYLHLHLYRHVYRYLYLCRHIYLYLDIFLISFIFKGEFRFEDEYGVKSSWRFLEIVNVRQDMERQKGKVTTDMVFNFFKQCAFAKRSETITKNLLENVNAIWNRFKAAPGAMAVAREADALYGNDSPFSGILQMYSLCAKAGKDPKQVSWLFTAIFDSFRAGLLTKEDVNYHKIQDSKRVSVVDTLLFKKALLAELLGAELERMRLPLEDTVLCRKQYMDHSTFRAARGFDDGAKAKTFQKIDLSWQMNFSKAGLLYSQLIEGLVYGVHYDGALRQCIKNSKSCEDTMRFGLRRGSVTGGRPKTAVVGRPNSTLRAGL